jgi:hypothetical protein
MLIWYIEKGKNMHKYHVMGTKRMVGRGSLITSIYQDYFACMFLGVWICILGFCRVRM